MGKDDLTVGDRMPDGSVYAGISPDNGRPMFAAAADAPGLYDFDQAQQYAQRLVIADHDDFKVPSTGELKVLFENRDKGKLAGTFNETGAPPAGMYWSSTPDDYGGFDGRDQSFSPVGYPPCSQHKEKAHALRVIRYG